MQKQPLWTKNFMGVSMSNFFLFLTFYLLMVTLPIYTMEQLNGSAAEIGLVVTIFLIGAIIVRPFSGIWIVHIGERKMLTISLTLILISSVLYCFSNSLITLLIFRFIHGLGFGMATTATNTLVAKLIPDNRRGEGMGYYATFMNLAMVLGPFIGLTLVQYISFTMIFIICTIFGVLSILFLSLISMKQIEAQSITKPKMQFTFKQLIYKKAVPISIVAGTLAIGYASILSFVSVYAAELNLISAASYFFVVYAVFLLASRPFTGKWFDQYGENVIIYPAILLFGIGVLLLSQAQGTFVFLLSGAVIGIGFGTITSALQTIAIRTASQHSIGMATSTYFTFFDTGIGFGSFILGTIAVSMGYSKLYFILGFFILACLGLYYLLHGRVQHSKPSEN
ncbi:MFS transporter [Lederbergia lenta]|uniref:Major facilitator superfamily protein n=1 Tax=Lederbergia lenta TaxID=1467 RepID=A0A2X4Z0Q5_LEDLE|nr:MFS transporter [Lederbergia lenta]MCM3111025.1 MFS transporter [Lederbergia lenta]MEC2325587.1 MFS transporter [Lederbergia lenta]SQI54204.1 major facilitator superfamily protein [Lederbergia lenta]